MKLKERLTSIFSNDLYQNIMKLLSGNLIARIIPMVFAIGLARLYAPEAFGNYLLMMTIASVLSIVSTGKFESPVIIAENEQSCNSMYAYGLKLNFLLNALFLLLGLVVNFVTQSNYFLFEQLILVVAYSFLFGSIQFVRSRLTRKKDFTTIAKIEIYRALCIGIFQFVFYKKAALGLMLGATIGQIVPLIVVALKKDYIPPIAMFQQSIFRNELAKRYIHFPKFALPSELLNFVSSQLPILVFKPMFGGSLMGNYSFGHRYISIPVQLFSKSISNVLVEKVVALKDDFTQLKATVSGLFRKQILLGIVPFTILALWGEPIFSFVFGNEWSDAGKMAQYIAPWLFMVMLGSPLSAIITAFEKQKFSMYFNFLLVFFRVAAIVAGYFIFNSIMYAVALYSLVGAIFFGILTGYSLSLVDLRLKSFLKFFLQVVLLVVLPLILLKLWL